MRAESRFRTLMWTLLSLLFLTQSAAFAVGAPGFIPDGPHPRIWLTAEELGRLSEKRDRNDQAYAALISWCDAHLADKGYDVDPLDQSKFDLTNWGSDNNYTTGYRMSGFNQQIMNFALAYQVFKAPGPGQNLPKADVYAARVRTLLIGGIATALRAGEEANGLKALRVGTLHDLTINADEAAVSGVGKGGYKQGYASRNLACVPIAYDWIYDTLSDSDKAILAPMMMRWFDWIEGVRSKYNNGVLINGIRYHEDRSGDCSGNNNCTTLTGVSSKAFDYGNMSGNFNGGHTYLLSLIPVAIYGYNTDVANYLTRFKSLFANTVIDQLESDVKHSGGDSVEGWNYGGGFINTLSGLYGYYTATGDTAFSSMTWPSKLVDAMVHRLGPNLLDVPIYGYWTGTPIGQNRAYIALRVVGIHQRLRPQDELSKVGQYLLKNVKYGDALEQWMALLWPRADIAETSPARLPLVHLAAGNGYFSSRSSWTDPNTVSVSVRLEGKVSASHEGYDEGHLAVSRGADRLLVHQNSVGDSPPAVSFNTVVFNNQSHHGSNPPLQRPAIDRYEGGDGYSYTSGEISNAWRRAYNPERAKLFRRSMVHVLPGFVVTYDVTRSNTSVGTLKEWYTQYMSGPSISGKTITATVGSSKLYVSTLFPAEGTFLTTTPATGYWRVKFTPAVQQEYEQFLHVIEATASTSTGPTPTQIVKSSDDKMVGTYINDAANPTVVMFSADKDGNEVSGNVTYTLPVPTNRQPLQIIVQLPPDKDYTVVRPKTKAAPQTYQLLQVNDPSQGVVYRTSTQGVLRIPPSVSSPQGGNVQWGRQ